MSLSLAFEKVHHALQDRTLKSSLRSQGTSRCSVHVSYVNLHVTLALSPSNGYLRQSPHRVFTGNKLFRSHICTTQKIWLTCRSRVRRCPNPAGSKSEQLNANFPDPSKLRTSEGGRPQSATSSYLEVSVRCVDWLQQAVRCLNSLRKKNYVTVHERNLRSATAKHNDMR